jgi:hypothetical protein
VNAASAHRQAPMTADVLPFISWLGNARHRTAVHAFAPNRSLSLCKTARRDVPANWKTLDGQPKCKRCVAEVARLTRHVGGAR